MLATTETNERNAEIAALNQQVAFLRSALAKVEGKLAELGGNKPASKHATNVTADPPSPVFPKELFLELVQYLKPGSRTLLNLASTCRDLYALLLPRLLEKIDSNLLLLDHRFSYYRRDNFKLLENRVKEVDLFPLKLPPKNIESLPPLVQTSVDFLYYIQDSLQRLRIRFDGEYSNEDVVEDPFSIYFFPEVSVLQLDDIPPELPKN